MSVAVATLGCTRKRNSIHSWDTLTRLQGDYRLYINWEHQTPIGSIGIKEDQDFLINTYNDLRVSAEGRTLDSENLYIDTWSWNTFEGSSWRSHPRFDQDQARLASIVTARNMSIEFAMQTNVDHLLFIDADIVPELSIVEDMLRASQITDRDAICGLVNGRGTHSSLQYIFGEKQRFSKDGMDFIEVEHANIGFTMLSRRLFNQIRFRYGHSEYPDGRNHMVSDDPAYHLDAFIKFGQWPVICTNIKGSHVGVLNNYETAQF